jgi:hypothetical protein
MNDSTTKTSARDAAGVPTELRELLALLAELAEPLPPAADGNWERRRQQEGRRDSKLRVVLGFLNTTLAALDEYPTVAEAALARDCQRWAEEVRERLAEPLGYVTEDGAQ